MLNSAADYIEDNADDDDADVDDADVDDNDADASGDDNDQRGLSPCWSPPGGGFGFRGRG